MAEQLSFDWPARVALGREDFFVTDANRAAFALVSSPADWPLGKLCVVGPAGSGKTHLARVFAQESGAPILAARAIDPAAPLPPDRALVLEDMETLPREAEEWVFHVHNDLAARGGHLLLTAERPPSRWPIALPDLASRMQGTAVTRIDDPDEVLLSAVLMKQFQDRQLSPTPAAMDTLVRHLDRSFALAHRAVATLDRMSLARGRPITKDLAREMLDKMREAGG